MCRGELRRGASATLTALAKALVAGQEVVLPPLGKLKVVREKPTRKGRMLMVRLVLDEVAPEDAEPLAARDDHG